MNPACSDATGSKRTNLTANDQDVRQNPDAGKSQPVQQPIPTVSVDNDRQTIGLPPLFFPPQQELTSQFNPGAPPSQLSASQPLLRGLEAARGSGNAQTDAPGSLALQVPGPGSYEQASRITGGPSQAQGSEPCMVQPALDKHYRSKLSAWVESAAPTRRSAHQEAQRRINAYLEAPAAQRKLINLSALGLSTLHPLPADLIELDVSENKLTALPEYLPLPGSPSQRPIRQAR